MCSSMLIGMVNRTEYVMNPFVRSACGLHPDFTPMNYGCAKDPEEAIELFKEQVLRLRELESGDFKRLANGYIVRLGDAVGGLNPAIQRRLDLMQGYTQYTAHPNIREVKARLLRDAEIIESWLRKRVELFRKNTAATQIRLHRVRRSAAPSSRAS